MTTSAVPSRMGSPTRGASGEASVIQEWFEGGGRRTRAGAAGDWRTREVELDGRPFGPSGQSVAFEVSEGTHTLVLQRNGKALTKTITLRAGRQAIVKVDFKGERVYVEQQ